MALTTDVSRMYRAVHLLEHQRDLHWFVWREDPQQSLKEYKMTRLTCGVSASPFAAIMGMMQNAMDHQRKHPLTAQAAMNDFYVDDGLDGVDSIDEAIKIRSEMQEFFERGGFVLGKWKLSEPAVLAQIPRELVDSQFTQSLDIDLCTKVFEWNATSDTF